MTRLLFLIPLVLALAPPSTEVDVVSDKTVAQPDTVVVYMVDKSSTEWRFEPSNVTVSAGDLVRFVQKDVVPHNVEFRDPPGEADISTIQFGPFLLNKGETYDIKIDHRFVVGEYPFVCTPHMPMGMEGVLYVVERKSSP